jgi:hypothetical protein
VRTTTGYRSPSRTRRAHRPHRARLCGTFVAGAVLFCLSLPYSAASAATPAFVQQAYATPQTSQRVVTTTYHQAQGAGDTNIIAVGWNDITSNVVSVTDSNGNMYRLAAAVVRGGRESQAIYYASNIVAAPADWNTVTATFDVAARMVDLRITEYSGLDRSSPFDTAASTAGNSTLAATPPVTMSAANELLFGAGVSSDHFASGAGGATTRVITSPDASIVIDKTMATPGRYDLRANQVGVCSVRGPGTTSYQISRTRS